MKRYEEITKAMRENGKRFWAGDNISDYLDADDREVLIEEATEKFEGVLQSLMIDTQEDPNSMGTAKRLAKMYFNEIMEGRYTKMPNATAFPNDTDYRYEGMLLYVLSLSLCALIITNLYLV